MEPIGVLLANLGTPDAPTTKALRPYLAEFLGDPRVIDYPKLLWYPVLHGIILNTRPRRSAAKYKQIWTPEGSPLLVHSRQLAEGIQMRFATEAQVKVVLGMRYGRPSIPTALNELEDAGIRRILVLPLFPQYSVTTTASIFDAVTRVYRRSRAVPELRLVRDYHDDPAYLKALVSHITMFWAGQGAPERLLISFHGVPRRYIRGGDPYYDQCQTTARALAEALGVAHGQWGIGFQSQFGPEKWLEPLTDQLLKRWAKSGVKSVDVVCPGFATDCLETLEEVAVEYKTAYETAGGSQFRYIPCLNATFNHVDALDAIIRRHLQGWLSEWGGIERAISKTPLEF